MALTDLKIQSIKATPKTQNISGGDGLYLHVSTAGMKSWRFDYRFGGKRYTLSFSKYPLISLAAARIKRFETKKLLLEGIDPIAILKAKKEKTRATTQYTFQIIAVTWYDSKKDFRLKAWQETNKLYLERALYPAVSPFLHKGNHQ